MFPWNLFPFNKKMNNQMGQLDQNEIDKFVKQMMGQMMPAQMQGMMNNQDWMKPTQSQPAGQEANGAGESLSYSVFDTHNHVFVRISIKEESWLKQLKLYHTSNQLMVEQIPNINDKMTITLPSIVRKKGTTTSYKDNILEVKIPKNIDMQFSEIEIPEKTE
jgi:HSP20 family molecular chaperone IbpA